MWTNVNNLTSRVQKTYMVSIDRVGDRGSGENDFHWDWNWSYDSNFKSIYDEMGLSKEGIICL